MKNLIERDKLRRNLVKKHEIHKLNLKLKGLKSNQNQWYYFLKLSNFPKDSSITRIRNRCVKTGRARGNLKNFKLSRIAFRELALSGNLPGVNKSSF